jgi:cold shock CspA family protein
MTLIPDEDFESFMRRFDSYPPPPHPKKQKRKKPRHVRCGTCRACTRADCGNCINCLDKPKFDGPGVRKKACAQKTCHNFCSYEERQCIPAPAARLFADRATETVAERTGPRLLGRTKWYNDDKGFGFIAIDNADGSSDVVFVHFTQIKFCSLRKGEEVELSVRVDHSGKLEAVDVVPVCLPIASSQVAHII